MSSAWMQDLERAVAETCLAVRMYAPVWRDQVQGEWGRMLTLYFCDDACRLLVSRKTNPTSCFAQAVGDIVAKSLEKGRTLQKPSRRQGSPLCDPYCVEGGSAHHQP